MEQREEKKNNNNNNNHRKEENRLIASLARAYSRARYMFMGTKHTSLTQLMRLLNAYDISLQWAAKRAHTHTTLVAEKSTADQHRYTTHTHTLHTVRDIFGSVCHKDNWAQQLCSRCCPRITLIAHRMHCAVLSCEKKKQKQTQPFLSHAE